MKPLDLVKVAKSLVGNDRRRPTDAYLRRATSSCYYALFHCLAANCADTLVGKTNVVRRSSAWLKTYRALEHRFAKSACQNRQIDFPQAIKVFAQTFVTMQEQRHAADYNPAENFTKSEVLAKIQEVEAVIRAFKACDLLERRAFSAHVLFKERP
jgi:uncharacterized protein (UPF0332 family)